MSKQHLLFQKVQMAKNDAEYNMVNLNKYMNQLADRLDQLENEMNCLPLPHNLLRVKKP